MRCVDEFKKFDSLGVLVLSVKRYCSKCGLIYTGVKEESKSKGVLCKKVKYDSKESKYYKLNIKCEDCNELIGYYLNRFDEDDKGNIIYKGNKFKKLNPEDDEHFKIQCKLCDREFKVKEKDLISINEIHYFNGYSVYSLSIINCPYCNKSYLTKKIKGVASGWGKPPKKSDIIKNLSEKNSLGIKFKAYLRNELIFDNTGIPQKCFDEAERKGYAVIK